MNNLEMEDVVRKLYHENHQIFLNNLEALLRLYDSECKNPTQLPSDHPTWGPASSTSLVDCLFLYLLVLHFKPKIILESGTFIGTTSKFMAHAAKEYGGVVHTCDPRNWFRPNNKYDNLFFHNTLSCDFLDKLFEQNKKVDMAFYDSPCDHEYELNGSAEAPLKKVASKKFIFAAHDYNTPEGYYDKGYYAVNKAIDIFDRNKYNIYIPLVDAYYDGHKVPDLDLGINGCTTCILPKDL